MRVGARLKDKPPNLPTTIPSLTTSKIKIKYLHDCCQVLAAQFLAVQQALAHFALCQHLEASDSVSLVNLGAQLIKWVQNWICNY